MVDSRAAAFVRIVNTTPKAPIVTNVKRNSIDHTEGTGTKRMCANVSITATRKTKSDY